MLQENTLRAYGHRVPHTFFFVFLGSAMVTGFLMVAGRVLTRKLRPVSDVLLVAPSPACSAFASSSSMWVCLCLECSCWCWWSSSLDLACVKVIPACQCGTLMWAKRVDRRLGHEVVTLLGSRASAPGSRQLCLGLWSVLGCRSRSLLASPG